MIEIYENPTVLKSTIFNIADISLNGISIGSKSVDIDHNKICEVTLSPIVKNTKSGTHIKTEYFDKAGNPLSLSVVIDSVLQHNGIIHFADKTSYKLNNGSVVGLAIHGDLLKSFKEINTHQIFLQEFGKGDRVTKNESYGELWGYNHYYYKTRKCVMWDEYDHRISLINIGEFEGNDS